MLNLPLAVNRLVQHRIKDVVVKRDSVFDHSQSCPGKETKDL